MVRLWKDRLALSQGEEGEMMMKVHPQGEIFLKIQKTQKEPPPATS